MVSEEVVFEAERGDPAIAQRRLEAIAGMEILLVSDDLRSFAGELVRSGVFPKSMLSDAVHIAVAMHYRIDYLLTWNCRHLANLTVVARLEQIATAEGRRLPRVGTPLELPGGTDDVHQ